MSRRIKPIQGETGKAGHLGKNKKEQVTAFLAYCDRPSRCTSGKPKLALLIVIRPAHTRRTAALPKSELAEFGALLQAAVYGAYSLGRSDALRQVADRLKALEPSAEPAARIAPTGTTRSRELKSISPEGIQRPSTTTPWWARCR